MVKRKRWLRHVCMPPWYWRRKFTKAILQEIEQAITESEQLHNGELRFVIENALSPWRVWQGLTVQQRALELFAQLGIWDTEENSGVLIYVSLADREVQILADRGIAKRVGQAEWQTIASSMQRAFKVGQFQQGALLGIQQTTLLLATHFPPVAGKANQLPNQATIL